MRALVVSDLHYSLPQLDWLMRAAPGYDLVIIAGDLLDLAGHVDIDTQIVVVGKYLARLAGLVPVIACSGNHDLDATDTAGERYAAWLLDAREDGVYVDGDHVPVASGLASVCAYWDGPQGRDRLDGFLAASRPPDGTMWLWVHHMPPERAKVSWTGHVHAGDAHLDELIARHAPDLVLSGHVHGAPFRAGGSWIDRIGRTWVFNPGRQLGALPTFIELELADGAVAWTSLAGHEEQQLSLPQAQPPPLSRPEQVVG